jgi:hypothetical protein
MKSIPLMVSLLATLIPAAAAHAGLIGPKTDGAHYAGHDIAYDFRDGVNGEVLNEYGDAMVGVDDDVSQALILPFQFNFYGQNYSQIWVSSNGLASFTEPLAVTEDDNGGPVTYLNAGCCDGLPLPASGWRFPTIAVGWTDLADMTVTDGTSGDVGAREYVIQWDGGPYHAQGSALMQLILHEGTNDIEMQYQTVDRGPQAFSSGLNNQDGSVGLQMTYLAREEDTTYLL